MIKLNFFKSKRVIGFIALAVLTACSAPSNDLFDNTQQISSLSIPTVTEGLDPNFLTFFSNTYDGDSNVAKNSENNPDKQFIKMLNDAKTSVDICAFDVDSDSITSAIISAKNRGIQIRMVVDSDTNKKVSMQRIKAEGIPTVDDNGRSAFMHNKFAIVDKTIVWTGSFNLTDSASWKHCDNAIKINNKYLAENYLTEFEKMFTDKKFGKNKRKSILFPGTVKYRTIRIGNKYVKTFFAPVDDVAGALIAEINKATKEIKFMSYSFTHDGIADALVKKAAKGVKISGIFEHMGSGSNKNNSVYSKLFNNNSELFLYKNPNQAQALMHHKVVIIDGKTVTTGSFNFTYNASTDNDENMLVISSSDVAEQYNQEFERIKEKCTTQVKSDSVVPNSSVATE